MTNRMLIYVVKDQKPLVLPVGETVRTACRAMWERRVGSALVVDGVGNLAGIFTGRDAVRLLAKSKDAGAVRLAAAMTRNPVTVEPGSRAIDALRAMCEGGFRHVPVTENGRIRGVVSRGDFKGMEFEAYRWCMIDQSSSADNRTLADVIARQKPLVLTADGTVADACRIMCKRRVSSVLVTGKRHRLQGIFTGRDAVRVLAKVRNSAAARLGKVMTSDPAVLPPGCTAIDALRSMNDGGFRHIPVVENNTILGVVSRNDFTGFEIDRLDEEEHLKECIW
jgi:CBS domain-containing protein